MLCMLILKIHIYCHLFIFELIVYMIFDSEYIIVVFIYKLNMYINTLEYFYIYNDAYFLEFSFFFENYF